LIPYEITLPTIPPKKYPGKKNRNFLAETFDIESIYVQTDPLCSVSVIS
jgi:hypothetical protein